MLRSLEIKAAEAVTFEVPWICDFFLILNHRSELRRPQASSNNRTEGTKNSSEGTKNSSDMDRHDLLIYEHSPLQIHGFMSCQQRPVKVGSISISMRHNRGFISSSSSISGARQEAKHTEFVYNGVAVSDTSSCISFRLHWYTTMTNYHTDTCP